MRTTLPSGTRAEVALPPEHHRPYGGARLGIALAPDIMGLRPLFDALCDRLAREHGWVVCAPEPFAGHEDWTDGKPSPFLPGAAEHRLELKP